MATTSTPETRTPIESDQALRARQMREAEELLGPSDATGFAKALFRGEFRAGAMFPYPELSEAERSLVEGDVVDLVSVFEGEERRLRGLRCVAYPTPRGCAATYFPEANVLVPLDSTAHGSNTPTSKSLVVRLERR